MIIITLWDEMKAAYAAKAARMMGASRSLTSTAAGTLKFKLRTHCHRELVTEVMSSDRQSVTHKLLSAAVMDTPAVALFMPVQLETQF